MAGHVLRPIRPVRWRVLSEQEQEQVRALSGLDWLKDKTITMAGKYPAICQKREGRKAHLVLVHRLVMENKLGRQLATGEHVHHIDHNRMNPSLSNLMLYASQIEHMKSEHSHGFSGPPATNAAKTHCVKGHPLTPRKHRPGHRWCRICSNEWARNDRAKKRANRLIVNNSSTVTLPIQIAEGASQTTSPPLDTASNVHPGNPAP
jgi:hypothetical protein